MRFGTRELLFLLVMIGLLFSAWYFVFKNADERIAALNRDTLSKREEINRVTAASSRIKNMSQKIQQLQEQITLVEAKLPRGRETKEIIRKIDTEANSRKALKVDSMRELKPAKAANYFELPVKLEMKGDFKEFYDFLLKMERMARIMRVNQMRLSRINEKDGSMEADFTLSIYYAPDASAK